MPFYATCSTSQKVQIVGPFEGIIEATAYGFQWSQANGDENRWHVLFTVNCECIVELLNPVEAQLLLDKQTGATNREISPPDHL